MSEAQRETSVVVMHGTGDVSLDFEGSKKTFDGRREFFGGGNVEISYLEGMGHEVSMEELVRLRKWFGSRV